MRQGIVFDLDGILWNSSSSHEQAYRATLEAIGIWHFEYSRFAGMRTDDVIDTVLVGNRVSVPPETRNDLVQRKRALATAFLKAESRVAPGVPELVAFLSCSFALGIATSASKQPLDIFLQQSGARDRFVSLVTGEDVNRGKPDPEIYALACRLLAIPPSCVWTVEDAPEGVRSAHAAGTQVIGLVGLHSPEELTKAGAHRIIRDLNQLNQVLF